ncbi:VOC family protein [Vibrio parahaemolyticus]|nr:VOC family protein [Vibrio parahaemolyticus]MDF5227828.1 VOC family protein [Vibrio parahaemolyticus]TOH78021.1 glyoxalase [Vibrio parahaemolyticus]TOH86771.1 glyoxalase [Vibrio parahaemolyticus]HCH4213775.1 VOC family protein [Vibrio parahaemolyticus]HCH6158795.1 VOC family protein [Vibrio parahaemolyticus]
MVPKETKMRIARPTDNLVKITEMYINGLGFKLLGSFEDHNGFDGSIIGHEQHNYHLEFTHHRGTTVGKAPTQDNLLVFYFSDDSVWTQCCDQMLSAGFKPVLSYNAYWDVVGKTFEDVDGYRVVLQNREWKT